MHTRERSALFCPSANLWQGDNDIDIDIDDI